MTWRSYYLILACLNVVSPFSRSLGSSYGLQAATRFGSKISAATDDIGIDLLVDTDSVPYSSTSNIERNINSSSNQSRSSYTALLKHYLVQNTKPKFHICVSVLSKIVEREGSEKAIRVSESVQYNISAENFRMVKNALLSALVIQRQTEAATSHLKQLLVQQTALDLSVLADLLGLYMGVKKRESDTTTLRRMYKKRALEASVLYNDIIEANKSQGSTLMGKGWGQGNEKELERGNQNQVSSDRIHEYGARAYADSREWSKAVAAIACISGRHMAGDGMVSFSSKLINRLIIEEKKIKKKEKSLELISPLNLVDSSDGIDSDESSFATELALLQPLSLLSLESPILHSSLLQLSASPLHTDLVIQSLREMNSRDRKLELFTDKLDSKSHILSGKVALPLIQKLFVSGCKFDLLVEAIMLLFSGNGKDSPLTWVDMIAIGEGDDSKVRLADLYAADTVTNIIIAACLLRDRKKSYVDSGLDSDDADRAFYAQQFARRMVQIPRKVILALSAAKAITGMHKIKTIKKDHISP